MSSTDTSSTDTGTLGGLSTFFSQLFGGGTANAPTGSTGSPFDFSGSVPGADGSSFFDPNSLFTASGGFSSGDQSGQTTPQIQGSDPGSQLQQTYGQDGQQGNQQGQPQQQASLQPSSMQNLAQQWSGLNTGQMNPWGYPTTFAQRFMPFAGQESWPPGTIQAPPGQQAALPPPAAAAAAPAPAPAPAQPTGVTPAQIDDPLSQYNTTPVAQGGSRAPAATPAAPATGTPDPTDPQTDPAQQAGQQRQAAGQSPIQNFLRSPLGQLIDQITGGQLSQLVNQIPRGYNAQNAPRWLTPQEWQQYQQTGQLPQRQQGTDAQGRPRTDPNYGLAPGVTRDNNGNLTKDGRPPDGWTGGPNNQPYWNEPKATPERTQSDVFSRGAQGIQNVTYGPRGAPVTTAGQADMSGTVDKSQLPKPSPDVQRAIVESEMGGLGLKAPYPTNTVQGRQANIMATQGPGYTDTQGKRVAGMSPNAIAGAFMNVRSESSWNPTSRGYDQPRYSGEASYAHGLYQEGGPEWARFQRFLNGRDWRNPDLQTQFFMQWFAERNPQAWNAMNNAKTPGEAAVIMLNSYLIPAQRYRMQRTAQYSRDPRTASQILAYQ